MPTTDVETICTDQNLIDALGSEKQLQDLVADSWGGRTLFVRNEALRDVLRSLARRRPPVYESDLSNPTEDLREPVTYRALALLYRKNANTRGDHFDMQAKHYDEQYSACLQGLAPETPAGTAPSGLVVVMERR